MAYKRKPKTNKMRSNRTFKTISVSWDTYDSIMEKRKIGESVNIVIRKIMNLEVPDPTRPLANRKAYYDEDWGKV